MQLTEKTEQNSCLYVDEKKTRKMGGQLRKNKQFWTKFQVRTSSSFNSTSGHSQWILLQEYHRDLYIVINLVPMHKWEDVCVVP